MDSKIVRDEHQEAEKSPTRRLQSRAPSSLALNPKTNRTFALENGPCSHVPIPLLSPLSATGTKATIPLLTPSTVEPKPLPDVEESYRVSTAKETQSGTGWQHPALQLQPRCNIVHKDASSVV
ncbi:uncharacterized protein A4U43_C08F35520 [Asparagus officinalis]|nr:uncharacterized protein A4U43_C08F35520 [Asparagus officinalis]